MEKEEDSSLRPATEDDLPGLVALELRVQKAPWTEENFKSEFKKPFSKTLILTDNETDSKLMGFMVFWTLPFQKENECRILNLAVDLPYRGMGLGKSMVQKAVGLAIQSGVKKITLEVRKSNDPALGLYQGQKFVITRVHKSFYSDGEDGYFMELQINA